jgi:hypothetical protein
MRRLDAEALQEACVEEALPWRVQVLDEVGSTSDAVRDAALAGAAPGQTGPWWVAPSTRAPPPSAA